ncbi:circadian clock KaiB family protein [Phormidesmis sp. 146-35]
MNPHLRRSIPSIFKGIALFTPGGDLVYCIDPGKQGRWHLNLCAALQEILELSEPPHFLVPCYTATLDRWFDSKSQQVRTFAEAYPAVFRYRALLNAVFESEQVNWQVAPLPEGLCEPALLATYRHQFPQLWENHDLVVRLEGHPSTQVNPSQTSSGLFPQPYTQGYVLRLFVSGYSPATQRILQSLHQLLEESLGSPYTLKVIDIFRHPEQAESDQVSATPTLVKVYPRPVRRIVGDLDDVDRVLRMLGAPGEG